MQSNARHMPMESYRAAPTKIYQQNQKSVEKPRDVDAMVLRVAADRLQEAQRTPDGDVFEQALQYNQLIWTVIQSAMTEENPLPPEVKANLVSLSRFIDSQTAKAIGRREAALVGILITINRNISAGLSS
jgi:flagellar protein FlaF